ncbi:AI-2E family transporter [Tritonibacter mobilis]|uniref:AI-2E family transporter n=1 Tax=Tritonibacter mobilis TaxID=379347 RepID=UPI001C080788|nr:AI-2E family transporter [Tritonibacter mobilis]MBU3034767.1 AI-2E family transporter [Tritonibacter mobilis]WHQ84496.1 AI-2E family transporter [Tritonibacter mobilis]
MSKDSNKMSGPLDEVESHARLRTVALIIIAFAVVLFLLVQARFLLISLAVAIILFSLTSDVIRLIARQRIGRLGVPNWLASVAALLLISTALLLLSSILLAQLNTVLSTTLSYAERAPSAVASLFAWMGEDVERAVLNSLNSVELSSYVRTVAGQAGNLMQGTVLVILFVGFLFAERIWFSTKMSNFFGDEAQAERANKIITSIIHRVNYYLLVKTAVSVITGVMVYAVASFFGIELALSLGILTFILNYIPNIGSIVATGMVALVGFVETGEPTSTALLFLITGLIQFVNGNVIDPLLMGRALRLSSFGIILSLAFWGAVWGVPGMFLSVPIMVMMLVICSHVPGLRKVAVLLSREGLPEDERELDRFNDEIEDRKAL